MDTVAQRLVNNEMDSALDMRSSVIGNILAQNDKITTHTGNTSPYGYLDWWPNSLWMNTQIAPYNDVRVRRAISLAINRDLINEVLYEGAQIATIYPFPLYPGLQAFVDKPEVQALSEEQVEHDQKLAAVPEKKRFKVKEEFVPVTVPFKGYKPGTIVIDTKEKYLYFVESPISAIRYAVAVGKEGLLFTGKATVGAKQPWPRWIPTKEMIERDPAKYGKYTDGMDGGPDNPLGARAIYLYQGKQDTYLRIHGTNQPQSIGTASSNGCFRMINEHVIDLYKRVEMGAEVVVL
jgi:lipoprotein-anchoring transpeptidase ErfK/SrfK